MYLELHLNLVFDLDLDPDVNFDFDYDIDLDIYICLDLEKSTQFLNPNIQMFLGLRNFLKQTIQKTLVTTQKKMIVRTPRKNWKIFKIQTKKLMDKR